LLANQSLDLDMARAIRAALCRLSAHRRLTDTDTGADARSVNTDDSREWGAGGARENMKLTETHSLSKPRNVRRKPKMGGVLGKPAPLHHNLIFPNLVFSHVKPFFTFKSLFIIPRQKLKAILNGH
jgi:hypothetical protein